MPGNLDDMIEIIAQAIEHGEKIRGELKETLWVGDSDRVAAQADAIGHITDIHIDSEYFDTTTMEDISAALTSTMGEASAEGQHVGRGIFGRLDIDIGAETHP